MFEKTEFEGELKGMTLRELKEVAFQRGVPAQQLLSADDTLDPKGTVVVLITTKDPRRHPQLERWYELSRLAKFMVL